MNSVSGQCKLCENRWRDANSPDDKNLTFVQIIDTHHGYKFTGEVCEECFKTLKSLQGYKISILNMDKKKKEGGGATQ